MSVNITFDIKEYSDPVTDSETGDETGEVIIYRDYVRLDEPQKGFVLLAYLAFTKKGKRLWAFADPLSIPSQRYLSVTAFVTLAQLDTTDPKNLQGGYNRIVEMLNSDEADNIEKAKLIAEKCQQVIALTDPVQKWLNLATTFLFYDDENPLYYDKRVNKEKLKLIQGLDNAERKAIAEWTRSYFDKLIQTLLTNNPECFVETTEHRDFFTIIDDLVTNEKELKDFLNAVGNKSNVQRDLLLKYSVKELYGDMATYIRNADKLKELYE